jgi:hypothetical protein
MADLTQINGNQRIVMGWYGSCDDAGCEDFPLKTQEVLNAIDSVYEIHTDSTRAVAFHSYIYETMPNQTQSLESLKCGHSYYIALKSGDISISIEEFVLADESTTQERYVTTDDQCGDGGGGGECPECPDCFPNTETTDGTIACWGGYEFPLDSVDANSFPVYKATLLPHGHVLTIYKDSVNHVWVLVGDLPSQPAPGQNHYAGWALAAKSKPNKCAFFPWQADWNQDEDATWLETIRIEYSYTKMWWALTYPSWGSITSETASSVINCSPVIGECPPCVKDATIAFSVNPTIRNQDSVPLGFTFSVDTASLASECSSNEWKYSLSIKDGAILKTSQQISTDTTLINDLVPGGGTYIIKIWGVTESGTLITPEPHVEEEFVVPWPAANYEVQGDIDITYLEFEGPKDDSVTLSDPEGWVASATIKKSSTITNAEKWKYSLDNSTWNELTALTETNISTTATLYFRLKVGHLGGNNDTDLTTLNKSYNSEVTIAYTENNGTPRELSLPLKGKVLNRIIGITSWVNNNNTDFKATLTISKNQLTRWQYQLEKLNDSKQSYTTPKILTAYGAIQSDTSEVIDLQTYIESSTADMGPGYYKISVRGVHNTDDGVVVTPEVSVHDFFNYPDVIFDINDISWPNSNSDPVELQVEYREYEGPTEMAQFKITNDEYFDHWTFAYDTKSSSFPPSDITPNTDYNYQLDDESIISSLPTTHTNIAKKALGIQLISKNASDTPTVYELGDIQSRADPLRRDYYAWVHIHIYGKNAISTLAEPANPVYYSAEVTTWVLERYITSFSPDQRESPYHNKITLDLQCNFNEINRAQIIWTKNTTELTDTGITQLPNYHHFITPDYTIDLNDVPSNYLTDNNDFNISVIGHSTTNTSEIYETGWIAGQVAPALEHTFTVSWPTTIFTVSETISDTYIWQGVTATPATNGTLASITKGWVKTITLNNPTGTDVGNWQYSINNGENWSNLTGVNVEVPDHTSEGPKLKFRLKANLEVNTYNDVTVDLVAHDVQSANTTKTINLNGSVTKPTPTFTISPTSIPGEYRETEGPSAEKTISISTKFLKSVKWKSSGTISWEYQDGSTWKDLPTNFATILNKPYQSGQTYSTSETKTIKVRLKADHEVPGADDMDAQIESHNFNNVITFEAISSHDVDVTTGKQVALNGTVTEYPNGCADYDLSFATTGGQVDYESEGVSINGFQPGGYLCVDNFGSFSPDGMSFEVRNISNEVVTTGTLGTNNLWASGKNIVYKAPDQKAYEAKNFVTGAGNITLNEMIL